MSTEQEQPKQRTFIDYVVLAVYGFAMGASNTVPGVSGGTIALILGIYEEFVTSVKGVMNPEAIKLGLRFKIKRALDLIPWQFLASVAIGMFAAVLTLSFLLEWILQNYPELLWGFFFGLIVASIPTVGRRIKTWNFVPIIGVIVGAVGTFALVGLVPVETPDKWWFFIVSGAIAMSTMVLPGVSGSFMLVLLGKYERILSAVTNMEIGILLMVIVGAVVGIVTIAQLLSWLFKRYHDGTVAVLTGMLIGSLRKVWPWKMVGENGLEQNILPAQWSGEVFWVIVLALCGFALITALTIWSARREEPET